MECSKKITKKIFINQIQLLMRKLVLFAVSLLFMGTQIALAQRTVSGKVTSSEDNLGIPGVAVQAKGTNVGTTTNIEGVYSFSAPAGATTIVFSSLGMKTQEMPIGSGVVNVIMKPDALSLEGVVVTGYGVRKKAAFTGASAQVGEDVVKQKTESNVINSLQGSVAGLQISAATGQPGAPTTARIRGLGSVNSGNAPLYVIDGVPVSSGAQGLYTDDPGSGTDPLSTINPDDIESISVLKDASATSIYGSRASNGVIVITTKKGTEGKANLNFNAKVGLSTVPFVKRSFQKVDYDDYKKFLVESMINSKTFGKPYTEEQALERIKEIGGVDFNSGVNTDWWDAVSRTGVVQEYGVTSSGGTEKTKFFVSGGYFDNQGIFYGSDFKRYTARLNVDHQATKYLTLGMNMSGAYAQINQIATGFAMASPIMGSFMLRPTDPIKNPDGSWFLAPNNSGFNPVALYQSEYPNQAYQQQYKALISPYIQIKFYKNVYFQSKVGIDFTTMKEKNVWSSQVSPDGIAQNGVTQNTDQTQAVLNITNTLNWLPSIGKNNFNVLLGQEAQKFTYYEMYGSGIGFTTPMLTAIANAAETDAQAITSAAALQSFFGNVEYDYDNKYYLAGSLRYDGSSRFGTNNKWGTFFSLGAKYRISQENFMANTRSWLNNLTIRVSYGTSGNQNVNYYAAQGLYGSTTYAEINGLYPATIENPNLKWESRNKFDVGLDFTIFDIFTMELDYYNDITNDMHFGVPQSYASGVGTILTNIGRMRNQGFEFQINALIMNQKNFKWTAALNFTTNQNEILKLATDKPIYGNTSVLAVGKPYGSWYLQEWAGVDPETGAPRWYGANGEYVYSYSQAVQRELGSSSQAKFYGGFSTRFEFFNFDFGIQLNYSYGNKVFINDLRYYENGGETPTQPTTYYVLDNAWRSPTDQGNGDVPKIQWGGYNGAENWSSRQLVDCSYLRIKSIMLGYTIPKKSIEKIHLSSFRAFVAIDNLYTFTSKNFRGYDPESGLGSAQLGNYPTPINYTLGINVGF